MSVVLSIKALMPSPDPPPERDICTPGLAFMKASSVPCATGKTVVDPLMTMESAAKDTPAAIKNAMLRSAAFWKILNIGTSSCF